MVAFDVISFEMVAFDVISFEMVAFDVISFEMVAFACKGWRRWRGKLKAKISFAIIVAYIAYKLAKRI